MMSRIFSVKLCALIFISLSLRVYTQENEIFSFRGAQMDTDNFIEKRDPGNQIEPTYSTSNEGKHLNVGEVQKQNKTSENVTHKTTTTESYVVKDICTNFIYAGAINLNRMVDLWQTTYYRGPEKVPCFKMFIRKLTMKEKQSYKQNYGNFDDAVEWEDCNLELRSSMEINKHFLQGCEKGHGVLENVIIGKTNDSTSQFFLKPESPDQWLVVQNLLLMRDCDNGDVVVFSRVPHKPDNVVITEALKRFGENSTDGKFICGDQPPIKRKVIEIEDETEGSISELVSK